MRNIHVTDEEYLALLKSARSHLDNVSKIQSEDSTCIGNKYTETNVGLCNEDLTTVEIAIFPEDFPTRREMKYLQKHHMCPLDARQDVPLGGNGCFHTCRIFKMRKYGKISIEEIKQKYEERIQFFESTVLNRGKSERD